MQATLPTERPSRRRWILYGAGAAAAAVVLFLIISTIGGARGSRTSQPVQSGDIATAFIGDLSASVSTSGQLEPERMSRLSANTPGVVNEVLVQVGDRVLAGDPLMQLDTRALSLQVERAQQNVALREAKLALLLQKASAEEIEAAEASVRSAQAQLDDLLAGPSEQEIAESEANLRSLEANVASASASYNSTLDSVSPAMISALEADLIQAQISYEEARKANERSANGTTHEAMEDAAERMVIAQTALDEALDGPNQGSVNSSASSVLVASANLEQAQKNHETLLAGPSAAQTAAAEASLAQAKANLATLSSGVAAEDIVVAQAELEQAQLTLADTEEALEKATIRAPFDGLITDIFTDEGEYVSGHAVEIMSDKLLAMLSVDEVDVGALADGQQVVIEFETWPDAEIEGMVASIAPSAQSGAGGLVTYDVEIALEATELPLLAGMTANARLITSKVEDVVLVPNAAITADRESGIYTVNLVVGEEDGQSITKEVEVLVGSKDDTYTNIISGVSNGDEVLVGKIAAPTMAFGAGGRNPFGGN